MVSRVLSCDKVIEKGMTACKIIFDEPAAGNPRIVKESNYLTIAFKKEISL
jgi:hypothetical protein